MVTLDIEMPNMNGLQFLDKLMRLHPLPVVMVSTRPRRKGASETLLALELGAVDFVAKPNGDAVGRARGAFGENLRQKVRAAANSDVKGRALRARIAQVPVRTDRSALIAGALIAIGASTGGVEAIRVVLSQMPPDCPPIVIAQHMPAGFTRALPARLDELTELTVREARGSPAAAARPRLCARAATTICGSSASSGQLKCRVTQDELISGHRPSVDVLFESVAKCVGPMAVGAILTGMGRDGARGLKLMRDAGRLHGGPEPGLRRWSTGMPRVAFEEGAVIEQAAVEAIAARLAAALTWLKSAA